MCWDDNAAQQNCIRLQNAIVFGNFAQFGCPKLGQSSLISFIHSQFGSAHRMAPRHRFAMIWLPELRRQPQARDGVVFTRPQSSSSSIYSLRVTLTLCALVAVPVAAQSETGATGWPNLHALRQQGNSTPCTSADATIIGAIAVAALFIIAILFCCVLRVFARRRTAAAVAAAAAAEAESARRRHSPRRRAPGETGFAASNFDIYAGLPRPLSSARSGAASSRRDNGGSSARVLLPVSARMTDRSPTQMPLVVNGHGHSASPPGPTFSTAASYPLFARDAPASQQQSGASGAVPPPPLPPHTYTRGVEWGPAHHGGGGDVTGIDDGGISRPDWVPVPGAAAEPHGDSEWGTMAPADAAHGEHHEEPLQQRR